MYLILTDETNQKPSKDCKFFVYGGLFFPIETLRKLDEEISSIREEAGYLVSDLLKFDTKSRPPHVSSENATEAKNKVIEACIKADCKFIVHVILHDVLKKQELKQYILWAADYVIGRFNYFLEHTVNDFGLCIIDNLPQDIQYRYLSDKFQKGLITKDKNVRLSRIKLFAATCVGAGHINSAVDIVLGSFRYCINNPKNIEAASKMMSNVISLMWHERDGETIHVHGKGLIIRPELSSLPLQFKKEYDDLIVQINLLIKDS